MNNQLIYQRSRWNGWNGNQCVYRKDYKQAIHCYSTAIEIYPSEYRYFVNRSFCYDHLNEFQLALEDSERAISLNPNWGKCYFRKARALKGLKRLQEAEVCLIRVIQLEGKECKETVKELLSIRKQVVIDCGVEPKSAVGIANRSVDVNEAIHSINGYSNDNKFEDKSNEKQRLKQKKTNKQLLNKSNNSAKDSKFNTCAEESNSENICGLPLSQNPRNGFRKERNVLKKLSDFLLNKNPLNSNENFKSDETFQTKTTEESVDKNEQKCRSDDNKSLNTLSSDSNNSNESKSKNQFNRQKTSGLDEIIEIWDDSRSFTNRSQSSRSQNQNNSNTESVYKSEPTNPWKFRGLFVSNIIPTEQTKKTLFEMMGQFGRITSISLNPETESAVIDFDNPESPRLAMSKLQGVYVHNICIQNEKLRIKFRPLIESKNYPSLTCATDRQLNNECYFWRTTGCAYVRYCKMKHIPANKGVDLQPWMHSLKNRGKRQQNRQRFDKY